jgi:hypothetical protein
MICFRLLDSKDPAQPLADAVRALAKNNASKDTYEVEPTSFRQIPNAPFAYWVSEKIRKLFVTLPSFESEERTAKVGLQTSDDFRFLRNTWETPLSENEISLLTWHNFAKGGSYSPYYADIFLKLNWADNGNEVNTFAGSVLRNTDYYFQTGVFQTLRTIRLAPHITPKGCIFGHNGFQSFSLSGDTLSLAAQLNSSSLEYLYKLSVGEHGRALYVAGILQRIAMPNKKNAKLSILAKSAWSAKRKPDTANLTSHAFVAPALSPRAHTI